MKNLLITTLFTLQFFISSGQTKKSFNFSDTNFSVGQKHHLQVFYLLGKPDLDSVSILTVDSLVHFLNKNTQLSIEIGVHLDRVNPKSSTNLSKARAKKVSDLLITKGINPARLIAKGYGDTQPLISKKRIELSQTKEEMEELNSKNRRTEIKITSITFK